MRCKYCNEVIFWDKTGCYPTWRHVLTNRAHCTITYAIPQEEALIIATQNTEFTRRLGDALRRRDTAEAALTQAQAELKEYRDADRIRKSR